MPWILESQPTEQAMPVFQDRVARTHEPVKEGDYIARVTKFEIAISAGHKTRGCPKYEVEVELEGTGKKVFRNLIEHPSCDWEIDLFVKCMGVCITKGQAFEFKLNDAIYNDVAWVDPIGLRGWVRVINKPFTYTTGKNAGKTIDQNEIVIWYTDREKLPRHVEQHEEPAQPAEPLGPEVDDVPF